MRQRVVEIDRVAKHQLLLDRIASSVERVLPVLTLLVAVFLRFFRLDHVPTGLLWDEAYNAVDALRILDGARPIFLTGNFGREALLMYFQAASIAFLGHTTLAMRLVPALAGALTIPASYVLARRLFGSRVALLTCAWLAVSVWHVILSRLALRPVLLPLACAGAFYCLYRGIEAQEQWWNTVPRGSLDPPTMGRRLAWFALSGAFIGVSLYTYVAARFVPFVVIAVAVYVALVHRPAFRQLIPGFLVTGVVAVIVFAPEGIFFLHHPDAFWTRARAVSVLFERGARPVQALSELIRAAAASLGIFSVAGDQNAAWSVPGRPVFDPLSSVFLLGGLAIAIRRSRCRSYALLLLWLSVMLVPVLLADKQIPNNLRISGLAPALFILPALGAAEVWNAWESRVKSVLRVLPVFLVALATLASGLLTDRDYFRTWATSPAVSALYNSDRWIAIETAARLPSETSVPLYVAAGDSDQPLQRYLLDGKPEAASLRLFDGTRSLILPPEGQAATYVFATRDLPPVPLRQRFFPAQSGQPVATTPDGQPIELYRLPAGTVLVPERQVPARFGNELQVIGFDLPRDATAGGTLTVRWYWRLLAANPRELAFFNQLFDAHGQRRGQTDDRAFAPGYWSPGTRGVTTFDVTIDPAAETGAYWLDVGVYERASLRRLTVFDSQGRDAGGPIRLGPIKVHGRATPVPTPETRQEVRLGDQIGLLGYALDRPTIAAGKRLAVTLYWSARGRPSRDYTVFVHLLDADGKLRAQSDGPPSDGHDPTSVWDTGEVIADRHEIPLGSDLTAGTYRIEVGMYAPDTGQRVRVLDDAGRDADDHIILSTAATIR